MMKKPVGLSDFTALLIGSLIMVATLSVQADRFEDGEAAYVRGDYAAAAQLWREAAEQGNAVAQFNLGILYEQGQGVSQNYETAAKWYRKAAEQGNAQAQHNLGVQYKWGRGVPQNDSMAAQWLRKAADQGFAPSQDSLGFLYALGQGVCTLLVREYRVIIQKRQNGTARRPNRDMPRLN